MLCMGAECTQCPFTSDCTLLLGYLADTKMTPEEKEAQRRSFAYGNVHLSNGHITREMIDKAAKEMKEEEV